MSSFLNHYHFLSTLCNLLVVFFLRVKKLFRKSKENLKYQLDQTVTGKWISTKRLNIPSYKKNMYKREK